MTRVLVTTAPMAAHVRPTVPLVRELVESGHEIAWYTGTDFAAVVAGTGARFVPALAAPDGGAALRRLGGGRGIRGLNRLVLELFLKPIPAYAAHLTGVFDEFRPDVVVADHSFRAGLFLAEQRGIPRVAFSSGPLNLSSTNVPPFGLGWAPSYSALGRLRNRLLNWAMYRVVFRQRHRLVQRIRADLGLPRLDGYSIDWVARICDRYLQSGIPEFEYPREDLPDSVTFVGPTQAVGVDDQPTPAWWPDLTEARRHGRPVVFVTQGTIATDLTNLVLPTIEALAGEDVLLVATTSGHDPEQVLPATRRPANLRLERFVPYGTLLPLADLIVTNGGYGGVQTALMHGVPLVVAGTSEDRKETNARAAWCGAAVSLKADRPSPARLRAAVRRVLDDPSYAQRAAALRAGYARYTGGSPAAAAILEVTRPRGPAVRH
jgi:MGT family glycosyltransferase